MAAPINIYDAKTNLSALVERAAAGEEIIIAKAGTPLARLVPLDQARPARRPGGWTKGLWIADDFDASLPPDVLAGFTGVDAMPLAPMRRGRRARKRTGT
jgi:prevent-host-death family protein